MNSTPVDLSFSYLRSAVEASLDIKKDQVEPCWVTLGVSLLMLTWYLYVRNANCPNTPISRPEEKRGEPRAAVPLTSSNYSEGPVSTQFLLCDGLLNQVPTL